MHGIAIKEGTGDMKISAEDYAIDTQSNRMSGGRKHLCRLLFYESHESLRTLRVDNSVIKERTVSSIR
ncbi:hypothetical protein E2C01_055571 [Portunus trituberculatus]|uniref:Uncharacterized protein n=1 Tax=Portunus trituberculatus TaxID=210409 RepID=A0A5B7GVD6_PORTR|nr:hypothetical protein [Portunus trituberculatus]